MGLFVYALVESCAPLAMRGLRRERLRLVPVKGFLAVVGDLSRPPKPSVASARAYDAVLRTLGRRCPATLPARFGSFVPEADALRRILAPRAASVRRALALVRGRVQMTLRVYGPRAEPSGAPEARGPGARHLHRVAQSLGGPAPPQIAMVRRALGALVRAERIERHARAPLLASVYHLIDRGRERPYRAALRRVAPGIAPVRVAASGPWPPYAFGPEAPA
jgi:hypothetical protein